MNRRSVITIGAVAFYGFVLIILYSVFKQLPTATAVADMNNGDVMSFYIAVILICGGMFTSVFTIASILSNAVLDFIDNNW